jgi:hypothetical protein
MTMPDPPERVSDRATPQELIRRLDILRGHHRAGLMTAADFNAALRLFQFTDDAGDLWAPGGETGRWYRWDRRQWVAADPPASLQIPEMPLEVLTVLEAAPPTPAVSAPPAPPQPAGIFCPNCGAPNQTKKFCTRCGTRLAV